MNEFTQKEIEGIVQAMSQEIPKELKIPLKNRGVSRVEFTAVTNSERNQDLPLNEKNLLDFEDLEVKLEAIFGTTTLNLRELSNLEEGGIVPLNERSTDPIILYANGRKIGEGEVVAVDGCFGLRISTLENK